MLAEKFHVKLYNGKILNVADVARMIGVSKGTIYARIKKLGSLTKVYEEWY